MKRPQDPTLDGAGWTFRTSEHGGEQPDTMPQAVIATDANGTECVYVPRAELAKAQSERDALREGFQAAVLVLARHDPMGARRWLAENGHA